MSGAGYGGAYGGGTGYGGGGGGFDGGGAGYGGGGYGGAGYGGGGGYGGAGYGAGGATGGAGGGGYMDNASGAGGGTYGAIDTMQAVTIKQVQDAANDASDDKFVINGTTANQVTFVARILKADVQMTMISLNLDDGTAVIDGSYMLPADEDAATREFAVQKRERIRDGAWVRVVGAIQLVAASRRISIYRVRAVDDHNEIVYHRLDVVRTFLAQTRPRGKTSVATGGALPNGAAPKMDVGAALGAVNDGLGLNPMQRAVFEYVKERFDEGNTRGIDIADIARDIAGVGSINAVREIMEHLASDGHVYATVDENHYAYCRV